MITSRFMIPLLAASAITSTTVTASGDTAVVASIKPVHSLVAAVMEGVGEPALIVEGAGSPHSYSLKPSQAAAIQEADLIFWIGHELEAFLEKPIETIGANATSIELIDAHDLVKHEFREGGAFEGHVHDDEGHEDHADDAEEKHEDHAEADHEDHGEEAHGEHAEADHDGHGDEKHEDHAEASDGHDHDAHAGAFDPHIWLDPQNAKAIVHEIEEALVEADPENAETYEANAEKVTAKLDALIVEVQEMLEPVKDRGYVVFHDAYQNFEHRFGVAAIGSITVSPEVIPGAERVREIQNRIRELGATCVFAEPQFEPKLVSVVIEGTNARSGVLDPLGASLENGSGLYFDLLREMAVSMRNCLTEAS